jgi:hypothetical protein
MRKERKGGCALSVALWVAVLSWFLAEVGAAWHSWCPHSNIALLLKSTFFFHLFEDFSPFTNTSQLHVVDHATSVDPRCTLFSL